jgi:hypothetical protein
MACVGRVCKGFFPAGGQPIAIFFKICEPVAKFGSFLSWMMAIVATPEN